MTFLRRLCASSVLDEKSTEEWQTEKVLERQTQLGPNELSSTLGELKIDVQLTLAISLPSLIMGSAYHFIILSWTHPIKENFLPAQTSAERK